MSDVKLLPCPFCGSSDLDTVRDTRSRLGYIECRRCHVTSPDSREADSAWNRRVAAPAVQLHTRVTEGAVVSIDASAAPAPSVPEEVRTAVIHWFDLGGGVIADADVVFNWLKETLLAPPAGEG